MLLTVASLGRALRSVGSAAVPKQAPFRSIHRERDGEIEVDFSPEAQHQITSPESYSSKEERDKTRHSIREAHTDNRDPKFETIVSDATTESSRYDEAQPKVKTFHELGPQYLQASREGLRIKLARRSLRQERLTRFHDNVAFPPEKEWRHALFLLDQLTPVDTSVHVERFERFDLPTGYAVTWAVDPEEATLEVMQRTGSQIRLSSASGNRDTKQDTARSYTSFTLFGTSHQIDNALDFITHGNLFSIVKDLKAEPELTFQDLGLAKGPQSGTKSDSSEVLFKHEDGIPSPSVDADLGLDKLDQTASVILQDALDDLTTSKSNLPIRRNVARTQNQQIPNLPQLIEAALNGPHLRPTQLSTMIDLLTATRPRKELADLARNLNYKDAKFLIQDTLVKLLTSQVNIPSTTSSALQIALEYLASKRLFPSVRKIIAAHDEYAASANRRHDSVIGASIFRVLLASAAKAEDIHTFRYLLNLMKARNIPANEDTWLTFFDLTLRRFVTNIAIVEDKMRVSGVLNNTKAFLRYLGLKSSLQLQSYLARLPEDLASRPTAIQGFLKIQNEKASHHRWLTSSCASLLVKVLLDRCRWEDAFSIVTEMAQQGGRPSTVLLHVFLDAANKPGCEDAEAAVDILQRFAPALGPAVTRSIRQKPALQAPSQSEHSIGDSAVITTLTPTARTARLLAPSTSFPPGTIQLHSSTYTKLFSIAYKTQHFNLLRVIWHHACCGGQVSLPMRHEMKGSLSHFKPNPSNSQISTMTQERLFLSWSGRLAVGIDKMQPDIIANEKNQDIGSSSSKKHHWFRQFYTDLNAFGNVRPRRSLAEDALDAWRTDSQWKDQGLGRIPKGLELWKTAGVMLEAMVKRAVQVDVVEIPAKQIFRKLFGGSKAASTEHLMRM